MLIWAVVATALGAVGWLLFLGERRLAVRVDELAQRARISDAKASAIRASADAEREAREIAEAQARISNVELAALRLDLAMAQADREALADQLEKHGADRSAEMIRSSTRRLELYGAGSGVRNRKDG